ncbi:MAG: hypothetical protein RI947_1541, partial [Candidatus Parcubacteria bacterium]
MGGGGAFAPPPHNQQRLEQMQGIVTVEHRLFQLSPNVAVAPQRYLHPLKGTAPVYEPYDHLTPTEAGVIGIMRQLLTISQLQKLVYQLPKQLIISEQ